MTVPIVNPVVVVADRTPLGVMAGTKSEDVSRVKERPDDGPIRSCVWALSRYVRAEQRGPLGLFDAAPLRLYWYVSEKEPRRFR